MPEQKVKVKIKRDGSGEMDIKLEGFLGDNCTDLEELENSLGTVQERKPTEERHLYENPDTVPNELST